MTLCEMLTRAFRLKMDDFSSHRVWFLLFTTVCAYLAAVVHLSRFFATATISNRPHARGAPADKPKLLVLAYLANDVNSYHRFCSRAPVKRRAKADPRPEATSKVPSTVANTITGRPRYKLNRWISPISTTM